MSNDSTRRTERRRIPEEARRAVQANITTRNWMWTLNDPTDDERQYFSGLTQLPRGIKFIIFQEERAPSTGTIHFQGYLELQNACKIGWLKNNFNARAHYDARRGTQEEAITYCSKTETRVEGGLSLRLGEPTGRSAMDARKEREETLDQLRECKIKLKDVPSRLLLNQGFLNAARYVLSTTLGPEREVEVITIIGGTGIGKSYSCYKFAGTNLVTYSGNGWFGGADSQGDNLLWDEFTGGFPFSDFLKLLDGYRCQLAVKGSFFPACYTRVFITSNVMPELWWTAKGPENEELELKRKGNKEALFRRIGYTGPNGEYPQFENGHFIHIPENLSIQEARRMLHQRLYMLGIQIPGQENHQEEQLLPPPPEEEEEIIEPPHQVPRPLDQLDDLFASSL